MDKKRKSFRLAATLSALLAACILLLAACGNAPKTSNYSNGASVPATAAPAPGTPEAPHFAGGDTETAAEDAGGIAGNPTVEGGSADEGATGPVLSAPQDGRKIIMTAWLNIEALDFKASCAAIAEAAQQVNGYVSGSEIQDNGSEHYSARTATFVIKVPAENYAQFMNSAASAGNLVHRTEQSEDVSSQYIDIEARLKSLKAQEERLLVMMNEATRLSDVIEIQNQLTNVQYEIETYTGHLRSLDNRVAYSTINITVTEVFEYHYEEPVPLTYWEKMRNTFLSSWSTALSVIQDLGLVVIWLLPLLLLVAVVLVIVLVSVKAARKKRLKNPPQQPSAPFASPLGHPIPPSASAPYNPYPPYPVPLVEGPKAEDTCPHPTEEGTNSDSSLSGTDDTAPKNKTADNRPPSGDDTPAADTTKTD